MEPTSAVRHRRFAWGPQRHFSAVALIQRYTRGMATIQIRDIPDDVYETIRRRAKAAGQSIQAYMRQRVIEDARRRSKEEALARIDAMWVDSDSPGLTLDFILDALDELRR